MYDTCFESLLTLAIPIDRLKPYRPGKGIGAMPRSTERRTMIFGDGRGWGGEK